jgi:hypothetical protein
MKTAMQILISELEDGLRQDEIKVSPKELLQNLIWRCEGLLEKEKEQIKDAYKQGTCHHGDGYTATEYYEETFNNNNK